MNTRVTLMEAESRRKKRRTKNQLRGVKVSDAAAGPLSAGRVFNKSLQKDPETKTDSFCLFVLV